MSEPVHADQIARKDFSQSFRGFDQGEVRAYLAQVAADVAVWQERVGQLQDRIAELESTPPAELEEEALEIALGREATRVLHAAREAAADIRTRAETEAAAKIAQADARLAVSTNEAEAAAERVREEATVRAGAIIEEASAERESVLAALAGRRRALEHDLAALQAARDALAVAFEAARGALDAAASGVRAAGDAATAAVDAPPSPVVESVPPPPVAAEPEPIADAQPVVVEPEPAPAPAAVEPAPDTESVAAEPESESAPDPAPDAERRSSSLTLVRPLENGRGTPVAPPVEDAFEGVRIIRPEPEPEPESEPEPALEVDAEPEADVTVEDAAVEGLFARLRADRAEKVAHAEAVLASSAPTEDDQPDGVETEPDAAPEDVAPDLAVLAARDERLAADERALVRALKRALADEQNEVLDALRRLRGAPAVAGLLPERTAHDARFESVLSRGVGIAATAGGEVAGGDGGSAKEVAAELGRSVVADLRARVERAIEEASGDVETLAEAISSAYREWKTARAEPLARDAITAGFAAGMYAASTGTLRWVVDPAEGGCPDCDDNVLAGATAKGAAYPTGQLHPPAHAGCRCVVVTAS